MTDVPNKPDPLPCQVATLWFKGDEPGYSLQNNTMEPVITLGGEWVLEPHEVFHGVPIHHAVAVIVADKVVAVTGLPEGCRVLLGLLAGRFEVACTP